MSMAMQTYILVIPTNIIKHATSLFVEATRTKRFLIRPESLHYTCINTFLPLVGRRVDLPRTHTRSSE